MKSKIPIFPLNLVMFPEARYPLHIFEERYKRMILRCMENNEEFGMISKIDLEIANIGCRAKVINTIQTYENGSMDILIQGGARFKVLSTSMHQDGYLEADVIPFDDAISPMMDERMFQTVLDKFTFLLDKTEINLDKSFWKNLEQTDFKSFKLAEKSGLNLKQQQNILNYQSEHERINYLLEHYEKVQKYLDANEALRDIIAGDGYVNEF
jgi:Lon protease-like protein